MAHDLLLHFVHIFFPLYLACNSWDSTHLLPSILLVGFSCPISSCPAIGYLTLYQPMRVIPIYSVQRLFHNRLVRIPHLGKTPRKLSCALYIFFEGHWGTCHMCCIHSLRDVCFSILWLFFIWVVCLCYAVIVLHVSEFLSLFG